MTYFTKKRAMMLILVKFFISDHVDVGIGRYIYGNLISQVEINSKHLTSCIYLGLGS